MRKYSAIWALTALSLSTLGLSTVGFSAFALSEPAAKTDAKETLPPGVEQILPRGHIPPIVEPQFVSAKEAEIADEAWILGVAIDGEARAYSLNLLNHHEIVNDRIGEKTFAAVW